MIARKNGFTIVELLIVIVIIGILAAVTIVAYNGISARALQSEKQAKLTVAYKALLNFHTLNGYYPVSNNIDGSDGATLLGLSLKDIEPSDANGPGNGIESGFIDSGSRHLRYMAWPQEDGGGGMNDCGAAQQCQSFDMGFYDRVTNQVVRIRNPGHRGY